MSRSWRGKKAGEDAERLLQEAFGVSEDQLLKDFLDMDSSQIVTMHIQSVDQNRAIKTVKRTITELDRSKIEEQKKSHPCRV